MNAALGRIAKRPADSSPDECRLKGLISAPRRISGMALTARQNRPAMAAGRLGKGRPMSVSECPAPPETFNFARHLLEANAGRPGKAAFIDDKGMLTYGALNERVRRFAAGLKEAGVRREERVLLLMNDCADWPVAFLGALWAGIV